MQIIHARLVLRPPIIHLWHGHCRIYLEYCSAATVAGGNTQHRYTAAQHHQQQQQQEQQKAPAYQPNGVCGDRGSGGKRAIKC